MSRRAVRTRSSISMSFSALFSREVCTGVDHAAETERRLKVASDRGKALAAAEVQRIKDANARRKAAEVQAQSSRRSSSGSPRIHAHMPPECDKTRGGDGGVPQDSVTTNTLHIHVRPSSRQDQYDVVERGSEIEMRLSTACDERPSFLDAHGEEQSGGGNRSQSADST